MRTFRYERLLHWSECDPAGIIFFPNYARWMVEGVNLLLLSLGVDPNGRTAEGYHKGLPSTGLQLSFKAPAVLHDLLVHEVEVMKIGNTSMTIKHRFFRDDLLLAEGEETRIWTVDSGAGMRSFPISSELRALLESSDFLEHRTVRAVDKSTLKTK